MRKRFIKYFMIIMIITVGLTLIGNFFLQEMLAEDKAVSEAHSIMADIGRRVSENEQSMELVVDDMNENLLVRADAFAEMIAEKPEVLESLAEMEDMAKFFRVEEVHVTDENGILRWGSVPDYYGLDFASTDQTRPFLPALTDKKFRFAQLPQPNGAEGKLRQYFGVARQDKPGIVQLGVSADKLNGVLANYKIDVVISGYNVSPGMNILIIKRSSGLVEADSEGKFIGKSYRELGIGEEYYQLNEKSGWLEQNGERLFAVFGASDSYICEVSFSKNVLFTERRNQAIVSVVGSILMGAAIIIAVFLLLKRWIINDMEKVNRDLKRITEGDLAVVIDVKSTEEFVLLGSSINDMVHSLKNQMKQITAQSEVLEEQNVNILASLNYARKIQRNLLPSPQVFDETFQDYFVLWEPRDVVGGDIYWLKRMEHGTVLCVCDCTGHGTPGALLTMIIATVLDSIVNEEICNDTAQIMWELEQRLVSTLNVTESGTGSIVNDGADLAVLFIPEEGEIILSSTNLHVFICDGCTVEDVRGQRLSIGDGSIANKEQIKVLHIPITGAQVFYIASDGLFEQVGGADKIPFGYKRFKQIVLEQYDQPLADAATAIWTEFLSYMGEEGRRDDVTLLGFRQK